MIKKYNSKGNYLYLVYDCFLPVVVENTELGENNSFLIGIILIIVVFIVLILVLLIISMCYCKRNQKSVPVKVPLPYQGNFSSHQ